MEEPYLFPKFQIAVYVCFLPEDHSIYMDYHRPVRIITICRLAKDLEKYSMCCGVNAHVLEITGKLVNHVVDTSEEPDEEEQFPQKGYWRAKGCSVVYGAAEPVCVAC